MSTRRLHIILEDAETGERMDSQVFQVHTNVTHIDCVAFFEQGEEHSEGARLKITDSNLCEKS